MVTGIWLLALRAALGTYFTLGPTVASAAGTVTGLVAVSALDLWVPGIDFGVPALAGTAIAVFILSATWEHVVRSLIKHRVLVIGTDGDASEVMQELQRDDHAPFCIVGVVSEEPHGGAAEIAGPGALDELRRVVEAQRPDIVILTDDRASAWAVEPLLDLATPDHLQPDPPGRRRQALPDVQVPDDARRRRGGGATVVRERKRPQGDAPRPAVASDASRRGPPALERDQGRDVDRRPAAGAARVRRDAGGHSPVLDPQAAGQAGHHRLGPTSLRIRIRRRQRRREAVLRPLVLATPERRD